MPVSLIRHAYALLDPCDRMPEAPVCVASPRDLTAMKLHAIAGGACRDFWDLHQLLAMRGIALSEALREHGLRYPNEDLGHVVRSLAYFGDAEAEPPPPGLTEARWGAIRADFERWVPDL